MARRYGGRFRKRRKLYRRRGRFGRRRGLRGKVGSLFRQVRRIQSAIETKSIYVAAATDSTVLGTPTNPVTTPVTMCHFIPVIGEGDDFNQREGRQVSLKKLQLRFCLNYQNPTIVSGVPFGNIRVMLVKDLNSNSANAQPTPGDLFEGVGPTTPGNVLMYAPMNWNNRKRFRVLFDKVYQLTAAISYTGTSTGSNNIYVPTASMAKYVRKKFKLNTKVYYSGSEANYLACVKNSIWLIAFADDKQPNNGSDYRIRYSYRLTFQDA